ncbi:MAG: hypothetical protein ACW98X_22125, partial [Promethearchaeota archaeon]
MNKKFNSIIILLTILLLNMFFIPKLNRSSEDLEERDLSMSVQDITIDTPENITYTKPMSGYYPATYGFEEDEIGITGTNTKFIDIDESDTNCYVEVLNSIGEHENVLKIVDGSAAGRPKVHNIFTGQSNGTVEFWIRSEDVTYDSYVRLRSGVTQAIYLHISGENFGYYNGSGNTLQGVSDNTWYHIRIDFECGSGGYEGLSPDTFHIYIGDTKYSDIPFYNAVDTIDIFRLTGGTVPQVVWYIDAVSFSWDPNYNVRDNLDEGLSLNFENSSVLDWMGYSLDGLANKTILGNSTIPMPQGGPHSIQVFGNDSIGTIHESAVRYFYLEPITIITPENKTYTEPMSGYYPGSYGFENEEDGTESTDIEFIDTDLTNSGGINSIISSSSSHRKVLQLNDNSAIERVDIRSFLDSPQGNGTIEWYWKSSDVSQPCHFDVRNSDSARIRITILQNKFQYWDGSFHDIVSIISDTWYHLRIEFECGSGGYKGLAADTYYVYINGEQYGPYGFASVVNNLDDLRISTDDGYTGYLNYFDAIGYSWDPNYNIGDNLNQGMLLSFDSITPLDWIGYSLDGLANKTILGNSTIPIPQGGPHSIQVFGNDSVGTNYESDIRYFSVKPITIITPENKTYTQPMSGYFPATYGFENEQDGGNPTGWTVYETTGTVNVISTLDDHRKVLEFYDTGGDNIESEHILSSGQPYGSLEWWWRTDDATVPSCFVIGDGGYGDSIYLQIRDDKFQYYDGVYHDVGKVAADNTWYHIRLDFELTGGSYEGLAQNKWQVYINGQLFGPFDDKDNPIEMDILKFYTGNIYSN